MSKHFKHQVGEGVKAKVPTLEDITITQKEELQDKQFFKNVM